MKKVKNPKGWQRRVINEAKKLTRKIEDLEDYLDNNPGGELLQRQLGVMQEYLSILEERINEF